MKTFEEEIKEIKHKIKKIPTKRDVGSRLYNLSRRKYGTWNNALYSIFGEINRVYKTDKQRAANMLLAFYEKNNKLPKANDDSELTCAVQSAFGTWNKGLESVFGKINQNRYTSDIWNSVIDFIKKYNRLPLREEFNGKEFPYWKAIANSLGVNKWSEIFLKLDLSNIKYFNNAKMGTGKIYIDEKGIVYFSRKEFLIGEWLRKNNILFEKEVPYENCNFIFDFYLPKYNIYIEYYGLIGYKNYSDRINEKRKMYDGRIVIEILKHENVIKKLSHEVQRL